MTGWRACPTSPTSATSPASRSERPEIGADPGFAAAGQSFAVASYRASLLPLLGDAAEASLQGATAQLARLPITFTPDRRHDRS